MAMDGRSGASRDAGAVDAADDNDAGRTHADDRVTLVDATEWPADRWDRLAVSSRAGHAFQSHAWGELKRPLGWTARRFVVEVGREPVAAVSLQERSLAPRLPGPLGRRAYVYAPRGPVLLGDGAKAARAALAGVVMVAASMRAAVVTIDPAWPADGPLAPELPRAGFRPAARQVQISRTATVVPLFADEAEQHRLVRKSTASLINRARRLGATVERVELTDLPPDASGATDAPGAADAAGSSVADARGAADAAGSSVADARGAADARESALREMHDLLVATARREGIVLRDRDYQLAQWRALGEAGIASLWFGRVGERRWTGSVLLRCGAILHQYQAGSADDADLRAVPVNHLVQWEILRWAAAAGFTGYDLGGVDTPRSPGLPRDERHPLWNLYVFKRGFGAAGVEYVPAQEYAPNQLVRAAWRLARRLR